jgi:UDP-glucose 4-epimerase
MKVLITGVSGKLGRVVAKTLVEKGHRVIGIDQRPWPDAPKGIRVIAADIRKRPAEDVFRTQRPDSVIHMATVTHLTTRMSEERQRINLGGTRAVFEHCHNYGVEHLIFVGRHTYYGAGPDSALYHTEDEPPTGIMTYPELSDLVAADLYAGSALWRYPELKTAVLRMVYTLGPLKHGTFASFLGGPRVPTVLGYDPLFQFMHEYDVAQAIALAHEARLNGVYNVAGPQPVPLSLAIEVTGRKRVPLPESLLTTLLGRFGLPNLPKGAISHVKYPIVIDARPFWEATGFVPAYDEIQTMEAFRWS